MRAVVITQPGGPQVLEIKEIDTPQPGAEQVRVRVRASALNRADLLQRMGAYPAPPGAPADVPGLEFAGEIDAVGPLVSNRRVGERVFGIVERETRSPLSYRTRKRMIVCGVFAMH